MAGRNPDASKPNRGETLDPFLNPIGSVQDSTSYRETEASTDLNYTVRGEGGSVRHQGNFNRSNPYFEQLMLATNNQDKDALYELAIQWEADNANLQEQREYNRGVLEEQREYDSPVNQIARARAAGINPDLEGSSGSGTSSGSSAQMQIPAMADQTGQTKFSNQYDNASLITNGVNTAANVVSTFTDGFSTIIGALDTLKTLPSRTALNEAHAALSQAQANEINELLPGKKEGQKLANTGQSLYNISRGISNSTATLQQLARFSELIAPDTADMAPHLRALGVEEAQIAPYTDLIKQMHANPEMRDRYAKAELSAKWSEEENTQYTTDLVGRMVSSAIKIKEQELQFQEDFTAVQSRVQAILASDPNYSKNQGELIITDAKQARDQQDFAIQMFQRDIETYSENIGDIANSIKKAEKIIVSIRAKALDQKRSLTPVEKAKIDDLETTIRQMRVLGSHQVQQLYSLEKHANRLKFYSEDRIKPETGESEPLRSLQRHNIESRIVFDDVLTDVATPGEIARDVGGKVLSALSIAAAAYAGGKGVAKGRMDKTYRKQTTYGVDTDGVPFEDTRTWEIR